MKQLIITIAAVLLVGCATTESPVSPTAKAPEISIHQAAAKGDIEAVKQHLNSGADVEARGPNGGAPLHFAALGGRKEIAELFLTKGADVDAKDDNGWTPLHHASLPDGKETVELLLAKKADVNAKDVDRTTPIDVTIKRKLTKTADLLRKHGGKTAEELKAEGK